MRVAVRTVRSNTAYTRHVLVQLAGWNPAERIFRSIKLDNCRRALSLGSGAQQILQYLTSQVDEL